MKRIAIICLCLLCSYPIVAIDRFVQEMQSINNLLNEKKYDEALNKFERLDALCQEIDNDTAYMLCETMKGQVFFALERYQECIQHWKNACKLSETIHLKQSGYCECLRGIAMAYHNSHDYDNARSYYRKALLRSEFADIQDVDLFRANIYLNLGNLYKVQQDTLMAELCYERASKESASPIPANQWAEWEDLMWEHILSLEEQNKYEEAVKQYTELIDGIKANLGMGEAYIFAVYCKGIRIARILDKPDEARPLFEEIISLRHQFFKPNKYICEAFCYLALCHSMAGNYEEVDKLEPQAIEYLSAANEESCPINMFYRFAGNGAYWMNDYVHAITYYEQYFNPAFARERGSSYEEITNQLSVSYILTNQPKKAQHILSALLKSDESRLDNENKGLLAIIYHNLGRAYMLQGNKAKALKYLNKSKDYQLSVDNKVSESTLRYIQECKSK